MTRQIAVALAVLAVLIAATLAADRVVAAPTGPTATYTEQIDVTSGAWYCVPLAGDGEVATVTVAAVGNEPSRVAVTDVAGGEANPSTDGRSELEPGETLELDVAGGDTPPAVVVRWRGGPVTTTWRASSDGQRLGAPCASSPSPRWLLAGANTVVGSTALLHLFNPFESDAVVRVSFATPEGPVNMVSSENLSVPARSVVTVDVTELQPEQPDLGLIVEVDAGRVIATGVQQFGQPDLPEVELEGAELATDPTAPEGRAVLHAQAADAAVAGFAYAAAGDRTTSWLTVVNPNTRPARLEVGASDQIVGEAVEQEVVVGPQSTARIDLDALSSSPNFGVTLRSADDVGFVAQGFVAITGDTPAVSAVAGVGEADTVNVATTVPAGDGAELALFNAGAGAARAAVSVGGSVPDVWSEVTLDPQQMALLSFNDDEVAATGEPVTVTADEPLYGALRLSSDDDRAAELLTLPLQPSNVYAGSPDALVPRRDRTLETRPVDFPAQPDR